MNEFKDLGERVARFANERDWDQFHSPKNLVMALSVEVAELQEHFQWLTEEQSCQLDESATEAIAQEVADVQVYLVRLADKLGINILEAVDHKMKINADKYPADKVRGSAEKYTRYE